MEQCKQLINNIDIQLIVSSQFIPHSLDIDKKNLVDFKNLFTNLIFIKPYKDDVRRYQELLSLYNINNSIIEDIAQKYYESIIIQDKKCSFVKKFV